MRRDKTTNPAFRARAVELYGSGMTLVEVGAALGSSAATVMVALEIEGVQRRRPSGRPSVDYAKDGTAYCPQCGRTLPIAAFPRDKHKTRGFASKCRNCDNAKARDYYRKNREKILARERPDRPSGPRKCTLCGLPATSNRHQYCDNCRGERAIKDMARRRRLERERTQRRDPPEKRGYDRAHRNLRKRWAIVIAEEPVLCVRCGLLIDPSEPWDLGHLDHDRTRHAGPEHAFCNRSSLSGPQILAA